MNASRLWILPILLTLAPGCSDDSKAPPADKGVVGDRGAGEAKMMDGAAGGCATGFAGCTTYQDGTAGAQTISFKNFEYTPKCLRVKVGQTVTFSGSFSEHPLEQSCGPAAAISATSSGSSATVTFSAAGIYGYYCTLHGTASGTGMAGAIEVVP